MCCQLQPILKPESVHIIQSTTIAFHKQVIQLHSDQQVGRTSLLADGCLVVVAMDLGCEKL